MVAERLFSALSRDGSQETRLLPRGALTTTSMYQDAEKGTLLTLPTSAAASPARPGLPRPPLCSETQRFPCSSLASLRGSVYGTKCDSPHLLTSNRSSCSTIRSAALPSHFGGIAPFFYSPVINRASAGWLFWFIWFIWSIWFVWIVSLVWQKKTN